MSKEDPLSSMLESEDERLRVKALEEVAASREDAYLPYILANLYHINPAIRHKAATALRGIKKNIVADLALMALTTEKDHDVIFDLILVFLYRPKEEAVGELLFYLEDPDFKIRSAAVDVLGALGSVFGRFDIVEPLIEQLGDPRPSVVMVTLRALVHLAESMEDVETMREIARAVAGLEDDPNRMVSDLAATVRHQVEEYITLLDGG